MEVGGADFMLVPRSVGFIKQTGDGLAGPPVIVYNHRRVRPGRLQPLLAAHQVVTAYSANNESVAPNVARSLNQLIPHI